MKNPRFARQLLVALSAVLVLALVPLGSSPASAQTRTDTDIVLTPRVSETGDSVVVTVGMDPVEGLGAIDIAMGWEPGTLAFVDCVTDDEVVCGLVDGVVRVATFDIEGFYESIDLTEVTLSVIDRSAPITLAASAEVAVTLDGRDTEVAEATATVDFARPGDALDAGETVDPIETTNAAEMPAIKEVPEAEEAAAIAAPVEGAAASTVSVQLTADGEPTFDGVEVCAVAAATGISYCEPSPGDGAVDLVGLPAGGLVVSASDPTGALPSARQLVAISEGQTIQVDLHMTVPLGDAPEALAFVDEGSGSQVLPIGLTVAGLGGLLVLARRRSNR